MRNTQHTRRQLRFPNACLAPVFFILTKVRFPNACLAPVFFILTKGWRGQPLRADLGGQVHLKDRHLRGTCPPSQVLFIRDATVGAHLRMAALQLGSMVFGAAWAGVLVSAACAHSHTRACHPQQRLPCL